MKPKPLARIRACLSNTVKPLLMAKIEKRRAHIAARGCSDGSRVRGERGTSPASREQNQPDPGAAESSLVRDDAAVARNAV